MPLFYQGPEVDRPRLSVRPSVAVEMDWVLSAALHVRTSSPPGLDGLYQRLPELRDRVRSLWGPDETLSYPGFLELSILAHHGGILFGTDDDRLLDQLDGLAATSPVELPLRSETPEDRRRLLRRMQLLRSSSKRRSRYVEVVRDVWSEARDVWRESGLAAIHAAAGERRALLEKGADLREFAHNDCGSVDMLGNLVDAMGADGEVAVVPAYFTHKGLIVDLPGLVVVGVRAEARGTGARARTEQLSHRLKAISDPTRLAILSTLVERSMSVGEIAETFALAQPTVSNHVKVLRDAGVVANGGEGRTRQIVVQRSAVEDLVTRLQDALGLEYAHQHG
jgi:DNA-binding transcriptional ArsR family regulator